MTANPHAPFLIERGSGAVVVFTHGFMGSPAQLRPFAERVAAAGYSAAGLLLPGHGGTAAEFAASTASDWRVHVRRAVAKFSKEYRAVILAGHSIGGTLSLETAARTGCVRGVFLLNPAVVLRGAGLGAVPYVASLGLRSKSDAKRRAYDDGTSVRSAAVRPHAVAPPYAEVLRLVSGARHSYRRVTAPVAAVFSRRDETVSLRGRDLLRRELPSPPEILTLERSSHGFYTVPERIIAERALLRFVRKCADSEES
ncbi:MAG: alpha/beta fold hydrolase [Oscillospiraceae bacterium]|jgi:carboxylesterase|nr:alpha/beta fold hydrolase [Oscillospiraceae bacterium]